jgi:hypothetical protein
MVKNNTVKAVAETKVKKRNGRPPYEPNNFDKGKLHCALTYGMTEVEMQTYVGHDIDTLKKHYPELFANVKPDRKDAVKKSLFYQATTLNIPASTIFWLKCQHEEFQGITADPDADAAQKILAAISKALPD